MTFYNEVLPGLYLGSIEASEDFNFIQQNKISVIVISFYSLLFIFYLYFYNINKYIIYIFY